jgi:hypothetical protein
MQYTISWKMMKMVKITEFINLENIQEEFKMCKNPTPKKKIMIYNLLL